MSGAESQLRVNHYRVGAHRRPLNARFTPRATELLRRREMSRRAPGPGADIILLPFSQ